MYGVGWFKARHLHYLHVGKVLCEAMVYSAGGPHDHKDPAEATALDVVWYFRNEEQDVRNVERKEAYEARKRALANGGRRRWWSISWR